MDCFLSIDVGNTRCKLRRWDIGVGGTPTLAARAEFDSQRGLTRAVTDWLAASASHGRAAVASVAAREIEEELDFALARHFGSGFVRALDHGLSVRTREPGAVGRDRLFAARGARDRVQGSAIVVDAGTALTVDAVRDDREAPRRALFLGGAIAPGPRLLAWALSSGTARLPLVVPRHTLHALGRDTEEAIVGGIGVGFRGTAHELVRALSSEEALECAPIVLTGGASDFLLEPSVFGDRRVIVEPELVHLGLLAAAGVGLPGESSRDSRCE